MINACVTRDLETQNIHRDINTKHTKKECNGAEVNSIGISNVV